MSTFIWLQIFGFLYLCLGLAMSFNPDGFKNMLGELPHNRAAMFNLSLIILLLGIACVTTHPWWGNTAQIVVSSFGWACIIEGMAYLIKPQIVERVKPWFDSHNNVKMWGWVCTILGVTMLAFGTTWL